MQKKLKNYIAAIAITGIAAAAIGSQLVTSYGDVDSEKESLSALQNQKADVQQILNNLEAKKSDSEAYLEELDAQVAAIAESIYSLQQQIDSKNAEITDTQAKIDQAEIDISEQYAAMKLRIQFMYENGNATYLSMIFDSKSIGDFLNKAEYISELTSYDRSMLEEMQAKKNEIELAKANLDKELADLQVLEADAQAQKDATDQLIAAKNAEVAEVNASITDAEKQITDLDNDIEAQQELVVEMESIEARRRAEEASRKAAEEESSRKAAEEASKAAAAGEKVTTSANTNTSSGTVVNTGKYMWPLSGYTYISSAFSMRDNPFGGGSTEFHNGIDLPAPTGTPIMSIGAGEVAWSYFSSSAGNWIGIDHGNGVYSIYMHMSSRIAKEGDKVTAGQVIGLVGSTGRSTGPHLHLSVRLNGSYVDPLNYVSP